MLPCWCLWRVLTFEELQGFYHIKTRFDMFSQSRTDGHAGHSSFSSCVKLCTPIGRFLKDRSLKTESLKLWLIMPNCSPKELLQFYTLKWKSPFFPTPSIGYYFLFHLCVLYGQKNISLAQSVFRLTVSKVSISFIRCNCISTSMNCQLISLVNISIIQSFSYLFLGALSIIIILTVMHVVNIISHFTTYQLYVELQVISTFM